MYGPAKKKMFYGYIYLLTVPGDKAIEKTPVKRKNCLWLKLCMLNLVVLVLLSSGLAGLSNIEDNYTL